MVPIVNGQSSTNGSFLGAGDSRLGASLSRSRSAQAALKKPPSPLPARDIPHSAQANQSFKIPTPPRRMRRELLLSPEDGMIGY